MTTKEKSFFTCMTKYNKDRDYIRKIIQKHGLYKGRFTWFTKINPNLQDNGQETYTVNFQLIKPRFNLFQKGFRFLIFPTITKFIFNNLL